MTLLKRFLSDTNGSLGIFGAVLMVPLAVAAGASIDYTRSVNVRAKLQTAVDSTALSLAKEAATMTQSQLQTKGEAIFAAMLQGQGGMSIFVPSGAPVITKGNKIVNVTISGAVPTTLMRLAGKTEVQVAAAGRSAWGTNKIEVALVLDNTGSMASSGKMTNLKIAAKNMLDTLRTVQTDPDAVKVGIVPFTTQVRVDTSLATASWLDFATFSTNQATWNGCIADRNQPADVTDGGPERYPALNCHWGTLSKIQPLTTDLESLKPAIDAMTPNGNTNVTIGLTWGLTLLSPSDPMTGGVAFNTPQVQKFIIALTDGDNTANRWTTDQATIDARTSAACNSIKQPSNGVKLYTIRVINGNANLLRNCATANNMYYDVSNASQLNAVFQQIAGEITAIRLTQ